MSSLEPQPYDPDAIAQFLKNSDKELVVRVRKDASGKNIRELKCLDRSQMSVIETMMSFFGFRAASVLKQLIREGLIRKDLVEEVNKRLQGTFGWGKVEDDKLSLLVEKVVQDYAGDVNKAFCQAFEKKEQGHVLLLLDMNIFPPVNLQVGGKKSPLEYAYSQGWHEVASKLLKTQNHDYQLLNSLLIDACKQNPLNVAMIKALVEGNAKLFADERGATPLRSIITHKDQKGAKELVQWMIAFHKGIDNAILWDPISQEQRPAFCFPEDDEIASLLLVAQAKLEMIPREVLAAKTQGALHLLKRLCPTAEAFRKLEGTGARALLAAVASKNREAIEYLLSLDSQEPNIEKRAVRQRAGMRESGETVLHQTESPDFARMLIDAGADVNAAVPNAGTALHKAAARGDLVMMACLLDKGAKANIDVPPIGTPLKRLLKSTLSDKQILMAERLLNQEAKEANISPLELAYRYSVSQPENPFLVNTIITGLQEAFTNNRSSLQSMVALLADRTLSACMDKIKEGTLADLLREESKKRKG